MADLKFTVQAKNGLKVRATNDYWNKIITFKHPVMRGMETHVINTLVDPYEIRVSKSDSNVLLYYGKYRKYFVCVVVKKLNGEGFIITMYLTENIKEGSTIWRK